MILLLKNKSATKEWKVGESKFLNINSVADRKQTKTEEFGWGKKTTHFSNPVKVIGRGRQQ